MRFAASIVIANGGGKENPRSGLDLEDPELFVRSCVSKLTAVFVLYGFDPTGWATEKTIEHWLSCALLVGDPMGFVKWKLAAFYAYHVSLEFNETQEIAPSILLDGSVELDNPGILFGGKAYRWMRVLKHTDTKRWQSFLVSILMSKTGMDRPGKARLTKAKLDTFQSLTTTRVKKENEILVPNWGDQDEYPELVDLKLTRDTVAKQIRRTVKELFAGEKFTAEDMMEPFFPSTSANYINSRKDGGAVGFIMDDDELLEGLRPQDGEELVSVTSKNTRQGVHTVYDDTLLREKFSELYRRMLVRAEDEVPEAELVALSEAFKVRVISKGPPCLMTVLKPLQKKMWDVLAKHPCFSLVGTPVTAEYVQDRMGMKLKDDEGFLSVDYKDATNQIESFTSEVCAHTIADELGLSDELRRLFLTSLTGHLMKNEGLTMWQTNGQLMGSVTSFPILCIVNAAICRWSLELGQKSVVTLRDARLGVNGDDGILRINGFGMMMWRRICDFCGLTPSVGKVYYSQHFLNINSTTYNFHPQGWEGYISFSGARRVRHFELVKYVNLGLLYSMTRSSSVGCDREDDGFVNASAVQELVNSSPEFCKEAVLARWIHMNDKRLKQVNIPWFIPTTFGGLGLPCIGRFQPRKRDLRIARKIYENPKVYRLPGALPEAPWKTWQLAKASLPTPAMSGDMIGPGTTPWSRVLSLVCVSLLFTKTVSDMYVKTSSISRNLLRARAKVVLRATRDDKIPMPEPFGSFPKQYNPDDLIHVHRSVEPSLDIVPRRSQLHDYDHVEQSTVIDESTWGRRAIEDYSVKINVW